MAFIRCGTVAHTGAQTKTGSLTMTTGVNTINCGFKPKYIAIFNGKARGSIYDADYSTTAITWMNGASSVSSINMSSVTNSNTYAIKSVTNTGFTVIGSGIAYYFAIG